MAYKIYGKPGCHWCLEAQNLLNREMIDFEYIDVTEDGKLDELKLLVPGVKSVPQIFEGSTLIGGYDQLKKLADTW